MRHCVHILLLTVTLLLGITLVNTGHEALPVPPVAGELSTHDAPHPVTDDYGSLLTAPAQVPALVPDPTFQPFTPSKYRTASSQRCNPLRRSLNRLSCNIYTPIASSGRLIMERMSSPLRPREAVRFYVFELCRLLC